MIYRDTIKCSTKMNKLLIEMQHRSKILIFRTFHKFSLYNKQADNLVSINCCNNLLRQLNVLNLFDKQNYNHNLKCPQPAVM